MSKSELNEDEQRQALTSHVSKYECLETRIRRYNELRAVDNTQVQGRKESYCVTHTKSRLKISL